MCARMNSDINIADKDKSEKPIVTARSCFNLARLSNLAALEFSRAAGGSSKQGTIMICLALFEAGKPLSLRGLRYYGVPDKFLPALQARGLIYVSGFNERLRSKPALYSLTSMGVAACEAYMRKVTELQSIDFATEKHTKNAQYQKQYISRREYSQAI